MRATRIPVGDAEAANSRVVAIRRRGPLVVFVLTTIFLAGCRQQLKGTPVAPTSPFGSLTITITPSSLARTTATCPAAAPAAYGPFQIALAETNGVGVTIQSWTWTPIDASGTRDAADADVTSAFVSVFAAPVSGRIGPHATLVSRTLTDCEPASFRGSVEFAFTGRDDDGLPVAARAVVSLPQ
jgi:hypothetical protein